MDENDKTINLFEADLYNYFYSVEKNRRNNSLKTIFIEVLKIVGSILVASIINLISKKNGIDEINITFCSVFIFTVIYASLQTVTFFSKWIYNAIYNKRSKAEVMKISEFLFQKSVINYMKKAISIVADIEVNDISEKALYIKIAIKYFGKSKSVFQEIFPDEEANKRGKREIANAIYLSHIGYPEIEVFFDNSQKSLEKLLMLTKPITNNYNDEIIELITYFQANKPRILALENLYNTLK